MLQKLRRYTREQRLKRFNEFMKGTAGQIRLIDLGGTVKFWENWGLADQPLLNVTLVNNHDRDKCHENDPIALPNIRRLRADVLTLSPEDFAQYDVIFSNSLIEHLPGRQLQRQLARAIIDSGRPYFLQTPNKRSPVDPHFPRPYVPFFAAYPRPLQARLLSWSALGSGSASPSYGAALRRLHNYFPLNAGEVRELFPQAQIVMERTLGIPMSIIAISGARN
ncbi:MAG: class I SAM-dependent methyltransferase [Pseudomonadota bacterium]